MTPNRFDNVLNAAEREKNYHHIPMISWDLKNGSICFLPGIINEIAIDFHFLQHFN